MKSEKTQEFAARIAGSSRTELTVVVYDVILEDINEAKECTGNRTEFKHLLLHATRFINELMRTLDFNYPLAGNLFSLYEYCGGLITRSAFSGDAAILDEPYSILERLRNAFGEVAKQDDSGPMMQNTQQITAGLTYGRGSLDEITTGGGNRGFLA